MSTTREMIRRHTDAIFDFGRSKARAAADVLVSGSSAPTFGVSADVRTHQQQYQHGRRGWAFASWRPIANRIAGQRLHMARASKGTGERGFNEWEKSRLPEWIKALPSELTPVASHPLLDAISNPNDVMPAFALAWVTAGSLQNTGKAYWWFYDGGEDVQIWYLPAHWVTPNHDEGFYSAYDIEPPSGKKYKVPGNRMCMFSRPDPSNPFGSLAPLGAAGRTILTDDAMHEAQYRSFMNGGMPAWAFVLGDKVTADGQKVRPEISKAQRDEMTDRMKSLYGGPEKHGKFIILDGLISDVKRLSNAISEMDYLNSSRVTKLEIEQIFGVNPVIRGENEDANRASAVVADETFCRNVINPDLVMMGQTLTMFLRRTDVFGKQRGYACYYEPALTEDPEEERARFQFAYDRAIIDDDEYRVRMLNLPPKKEGGNVARINAMLVEVPVTDGVTPEQTGRRGLKRKTVVAAWEKAHSQQETRTADAARQFFEEQAQECAKAYRDFGGPAETVLRVMDWSERFEAAMRPQLRRSALYGASLEQSLRKAAGYQTKASPTIEYAVRSYMDELMRQPFWLGIQRHALDDLKAILNQSIIDGDGTRETARKIEAGLTQLAQPRAMRIARSETTGALNAGLHAQRLEDSADGFVTGSEWSSNLDEFTRVIPRDEFDHAKMDGQKAAIGQNFDVSGESAPFPGHFSLSAGNRIACRCASIATTILDD